MADLTESFSRCEWAAHHFDRLQFEMAEYLASGVAFIETQVDVDGNHTYVARVQSLPPIELAFRAADVLHHLRAALDNAVWIIHPKGSNRTQFPVASNEDQWANVQSQVQGLPDNVREAIRQLQPFAAGGLGQSLVQVNDLAARDRHRAPQILVGITNSAGFGGYDLPPDIPLPEIALGPLRDGETIGHWTKTGYWIDHDLPAVTFTIDLQFGPETGAQGRPVVLALAAYQEIVDVALQTLVVVAHG